MVVLPLYNLVIQMCNPTYLHQMEEHSQNYFDKLPANIYIVKRSLFQMNLHPFIMISTHHKYPLLFLRAEKEKSQYFSELNDLRSSTNHLANDKVEESFSSKLEVSLRICKK